jgi:hypothetical protein
MSANIVFIGVLTRKLTDTSFVTSANEFNSCDFDSIEVMTDRIDNWAVAKKEKFCSVFPEFNTAVWTLTIIEVNTDSNIRITTLS